ncbi:TPA: leucyl/phenylalanyl-tRNA--protein transferase, partial [Stenotrophomonas maltophilia]|nr:leucyl/phenylalanyl-tRNA--protein transferase [Stenotrophomonas maltophilia]
GFAHSFEVWDRQTLVGGIYGVAIGSMFFGESMFSGASGGSKIALAALASILHGWGWELIDAQVENPHLLRMGAEHLPRAEFLQHVRRAVRGDGREGPWTQAVERLPARRLAGG